MMLRDLAPTQQRALQHAALDPLCRARGGYSNAQCIDDPHTVRCVNALVRDGYLEYTSLASVAFITARGRSLLVPIITPSSAAA